jgi:hypothetical protein
MLSAVRMMRSERNADSAAHADGRLKAPRSPPGDAMCALRRNPSEPGQPPAGHAALDGQAGLHDVVVHRVHDEIVVSGQLTERVLRDVTELRGPDPAAPDAGNGQALTGKPPPRPAHDADAGRSEMIYDQAIDAAPGYGQFKNLVRRGIRRKSRDAEIVEQLEAALTELQNLRHEIAERENRLQEDHTRLKAENQRLHRTIGLSASLGVSVTIILICMYFGISLWVVIAAFVGLIAIGFEGVKWLRDPTVSASRFVFAMGAAIAWALLAGILGLVFSSSAAPHPARAAVVRTTPPAASRPSRRR